MPKKKTRDKSKIKRSKWRKIIPWTLLASALLIGAFVIPANLLNQNTQKTPPKIDSISPTTIIPSKEFTVTGSGFTKVGEGASQRKVQRDYPGNWYQMKGRLHGPPADSTDGKTLKFILSLSSRELPQNCTPGATGKVCQIPLQVVNGYGIASNVKFIQVFIPDKPLIVSSAYTTDSPTSKNIPAGVSDIEVLRFKARADSKNYADVTITDLMIQTGPPTLQIDCSNTFGLFKAIEVGSGQLVGSGVMGPSWANSGCLSMFPLINIVLPPGTEKTFSVKMSLQPQAQVGLQFGLGATVIFGGGYIQEVDYPGPQGSGNTITIVAP